MNEKESKAQLHSAREKLSEIRSARMEQETRVREASNLFLKVTVHVLILTILHASATIAAVPDNVLSLYFSEVYHVYILSKRLVSVGIH